MRNKENISNIILDVEENALLESLKMINGKELKILNKRNI